MSNCPNCGAPIVADQCEYCGTVFSVPKECTGDDILGLYKNAERLLVGNILTMNEARALVGLPPI